MSGSRAGEKEPKAKWLIAILGVLCLGIGYYMAITTENALQAMGTFFIAVLFVIAGTYLVFMSGSIALLKLLKNNKNFYYHKKHFITVSGMMYRMKQNAAGLANICILSTAVLVVLSSTVSLYAGMDEMIADRYERDVLTDYLYMDGFEGDEIGEDHYDYSVLGPAVQEAAKKYHVEVKDIEQYFHYWDIGRLEGNQYFSKYDPSVDDISNVAVFNVMTVEDYNEKMGTWYEAEDGAVWFYDSKKEQLDQSTIEIEGKKYNICGQLSDAPEVNALDSSFKQLWVVVPDFETLKEIAHNVAGAYGDETTHISLCYNYNFNLEGTEEDKIAFCTNLRDVINETGIAHLGVVDNIYTSRQDFYGMYGSLFFIGIFIGILFLITTVMIIYYKQVSEGYDDRERFSIMQKVGMSEQEVKAVINNQIVLVFLLPIIAAIVHICFAFRIIKQLLMMFNLTNVALFVGCTIGTVIIFFLVYGIVYKLTAKAYYRITQQ